MKTSDFLKTLVPVAILLLVVMEKGRGSLLILLLPFFLGYLTYQLLRMRRRRDERNRRGVRLAIWSVALLAAGAVHLFWGLTCRDQAELAVQKVLAFRETHAGTYPADLGVAGLDDHALEQQWEIRYRLQEGVPSLYYPSSLMPLTVREYDFETRTWNENAY